MQLKHVKYSRFIRDAHISDGSEARKEYSVYRAQSITNVREYIDSFDLPLKNMEEPVTLAEITA